MMVNCAIRYCTGCDSVRILADAISDVCAAPALTVYHPLKKPVDILFLGSCYESGIIAPSVKIFISSLDPSLVKSVVNFSVSTLMPSTYHRVSALLADRGIRMRAEEFHCHSPLGILYQGHPDQNDLDAFRSFARKQLQK